MKKSVLFLCCFLLCFAGFAQMPEGFTSQTTIYLVRHAEKQGGSDPVLTPQGTARAGALAAYFKGKHLSHVYVTQFKRTQMTADSIRLQLKVDTVHYMADTTVRDLYEKIIEHGDGTKTILIVGHSNTIPFIIRQFGIEGYNTQVIPDAEYDTLFILTYKKHEPKLIKQKYGASSAASARMQGLQ